MEMNLSELWEIMEGRGEWHAVVHGVAKRWTQLRDYTATTMCFSVLACLAISTLPHLLLRLREQWGNGDSSHCPWVEILIVVMQAIWLTFLSFFLLNRLWNLKPEYMSLRKGFFFFFFFWVLICITLGLPSGLGKEWKQWLTLFFWAPKSLQMVIAAMKLKDPYSFEGKLWST